MLATLFSFSFLLYFLSATASEHLYINIQNGNIHEIFIVRYTARVHSAELDLITTGAGKRECGIRAPFFQTCKEKDRRDGENLRKLEKNEERRLRPP